MDKLGNFVSSNIQGLGGLIGKVVEKGDRDLKCTECDCICCRSCNAPSMEWCGKFGSDGVFPSPYSPNLCHVCRCEVRKHKLVIR